MIEYFEGVLFLTTNRKENFDEAFESRIHVPISFPELRPQQRAEIWKKLIQNMPPGETDQSWTDEVYSLLGNLNFNVSAARSTPKHGCFSLTLEGKGSNNQKPLAQRSLFL
jgi:SpoVK/Ycf46/Vps4 family AAA+-type ATPase